MSVFKESKAYRPFTYPWAAEAAKRHSIDMHWHENQIELQDDLRQYNSKDGLKTKSVSHDVHKNIVDKVICLFTEMDKTVGEGYTKILPFVKNNEIRNMMMTFASREVIHQRAYALLAESFGFSDSDWVSFAEYAEMREKLDTMADNYTQESDTDEYKFCVGLAQLLLGEGIGLFAAFTVLLNFKRQGLFVGFNDVNQWSLIDEQEHVVNNIRTLKDAMKDLSEVDRIRILDLIEKLIERYVNAEHAFLDLVYEMGDQEDLTKEQCKEYILYLAELRRYQIGMIAASEVRKNPLPWMEWMLSGSKQANFFEKRVTDYSHTGLIGEIDYDKYKTLLTAK
jgi:ribonucleotide reductase beta subunit family protein with ferritin-like domain